MSKEVVLYRTKTGFTYRYAEMIANGLECDMLENRNLKLKDIQDYDTLIVGGGVYIGTVNGFEFIQKNWEQLKDKKIYLFAVGLEELSSHRIELIWSRQMTNEQRKQIRCFYLRGGLNYPKLRFWDKTVICFFKLLMQTTKKGKEETKGFIENLHCPVDYVDEKTVESLILDIRGEKAV